MTLVRGPLTDAAVLITGGTGTFGQAFTRRALTLGVRRLAILSRDESKQATLSATSADPRLRWMIGDVRDPWRLRDACRGIDVLIHAAALKRVESAETNPTEALLTNTIGTNNVAYAAREAGVRQAVFLSTDKACAPNTLYGATKLTAERIWNAANVYGVGTGTRFASTRYGNVLGSTGSVVPFWRRQLAAREPLSITDLSMTRFWMTIDAAVDLVLLALTHMQGGETFIPKLGHSSLLDLVLAVAPGRRHVITGLRPGEKLHETLITEDEARHTVDAGTHYVIEPEAASWRGDPIVIHPAVAAGFQYRSDCGPHLTIAQLREMLA